MEERGGRLAGAAREEQSSVRPAAYGTTRLRNLTKNGKARVVDVTTSCNATRESAVDLRSLEPLWASEEADSTLAGISAHGGFAGHPATGQYDVECESVPAKCGLTATTNDLSPTATSVEATWIGLRLGGYRVVGTTVTAVYLSRARIYTFDSTTGRPADHSFTVVATC